MRLIGRGSDIGRYAENSAMANRAVYDTTTNRLLKVAVVGLSGVNALMWEFYTESTLMALVWLGVAVGFVAWIIHDMRR